MRIFLFLTLWASLCFSAPIFANGIVEPSDFVLNCNLPAPENLTIVSVTPNSVSATWYPVVGAVSYGVLIQAENTNAIVYSGITPNTFIAVSGLTSATNYKLSVFGIDITGCESPNKAEARFFTPFVVIDEIVVNRDLPNLYDCGTQVAMPAYFKLCTIIGKDLPFVISLNKEEVIVKHDNSSKGNCDNLWPFYSFGWQIGNENDPPPVDDFIFAKLLYCYAQTNQTGGCVEEPALIISVERNGNNISLCEVGGYLWKQCLIQYQKYESANGSAGNRSTKPIKMDNGLQIAPNPFNEILTFNFNSNDEDQITVQLLDTNGKVVRGQKFNNSQEEGVFSTVDLASGIYFLQIKTVHETKTLKVVKTNQ
jgi:Secretion system C-terminal sorting domain/Fibronectin type III domain